jgi:hypothetical protein
MDGGTASESQTPTPSGFGRRLRGVVWWGAVLAAGVALAPSAVGWAGLAGPIANWFAAGYGVSIQIERCSLSWWSPARIEGARIRTEGDGLDATIERIETERTLLDLLRSPRSIGLVRVVGPAVRVRSPAMGGAPEEESPSKPSLGDPAAAQRLAGLELRIEVEQGAVVVEDATTGMRREVENVAGSLAIPGPEGSAAHADLAGDLRGSEAPANARASFDVWTDAGGAVREIRSTMASRAFPLETFNPLLAAAGRDVQIAGALTCEATAALDWAGGRFHAVGSWNAAAFRAASGAIAPDEVALDALEGSIDLTATEEAVEVAEMRVDSDLGRLEGKGRLRWTPSDGDSIGTLEVSGALDLAKLARMLPHVVHVREDVEIQAGELAVRVHPAEGVAGRVDATVEIRGLAALCLGERVEWPKPAVLAGRVGLHPTDRLTFDEFRCESDFVTAKGAGSLSDFDVTAAFDLERLQERAGRFLDLGGLRLDGRATARVHSERTPEGTLRIRAAAKGESIDVRRGEQVLVSEPALTGQFVAIARRGEKTSIESCTLVVRAESDELTARLASAIPDWPGSWGRWRIEATSRTADAVRRAAPWTGSFEGWRFAGTARGAAELSWEEDRTRFDAVQVRFENLAIEADGRRIDESSVEATTRGEWRSEGSTFTLAETTIRGTTGEARWNFVRGAFFNSGMRLEADGEVDVELSRLRGWTVKPAEVDVGGRLVGPVKVRASEGRWRVDVAGRVDKPWYGAGEEKLIRDQRADVAGGLEWDAARDAVALDRVRIALPGLAVTADGTASDWSKTQTLDIQGDLEYDWEALRPKVQALFGEGIVFFGRDRGRYTLTGPLSTGELGVAFAADGARTAEGTIPGLKGEAAFAWRSANLYGFAAGPAKVDAVLRESWLLTRPIAFEINGGRATLRPGLFFGTQHTYLHHPAGTLADHVRITREMCDGALQYAAPVLAKAVDVAGEASLAVENVQLVLGHLDQADFRGKLVLHNVRATGSPLIRELLVLTEGRPIVELANESTVPFRVSGGRVYHENLQIQLPGLLVKTSGSVGFDQTMAILVETPVPKRWVGSGDVGRHLQGKTIKIPIGGTLEKPKLDQKALQKEIGKGLQKGAADAIEKEIEKQLNKFLGIGGGR